MEYTKQFSGMHGDGFQLFAQISIGQRPNSWTFQKNTSFGTFRKEGIEDKLGVITSTIRERTYDNGPVVDWDMQIQYVMTDKVRGISEESSQSGSQMGKKTFAIDCAYIRRTEKQPLNEPTKFGKFWKERVIDYTVKSITCENIDKDPLNGVMSREYLFSVVCKDVETSQPVIPSTGELADLFRNIESVFYPDSSY